jgi:hypothetical protein
VQLPCRLLHLLIYPIRSDVTLYVILSYDILCSVRTYDILPQSIVRPVRQWSMCVVLYCKLYLFAWLFVVLFSLCYVLLIHSYVTNWLGLLRTIDSLTPRGSIIWGSAAQTADGKKLSASSWFPSCALPRLGCDPRAHYHSSFIFRARSPRIRLEMLEPEDEGTIMLGTTFPMSQHHIQNYVALQ